MYTLLVLLEQNEHDFLPQSLLTYKIKHMPLMTESRKKKKKIVYVPLAAHKHKTRADVYKMKGAAVHLQINEFILLVCYWQAHKVLFS